MAKTYEYIPDLMKAIVVKRIDDEVGMNEKVVLEVDDPRRLSAHLAPIPPPPTLQIVSEQVSRFSVDTSSRTQDDPDMTIDYWTDNDN